MEFSRIIEKFQHAQQPDEDSDAETNMLITQYQ